MQRARPAQGCDCAAEAARTVHRIRRAVMGCYCGPESTAPGDAIGSSSTAERVQRPPAPPSPLTTTTPTALDDVLGEARSLVRDWEHMNGCVNAAAHVESDHTTLQALIGAVDDLVGLYEVLGEATRIFSFSAASASHPGLEGGPGQNSESRNHQYSPREWSGYTSEACTSDANTHTEKSAAAPAVGSSSPPPLMTWGKLPAAYLGTHQLDAEEAALVTREAVRYSVILLGEMLHDIGEDFGDELEESRCHDADAVKTLDVGTKVSARLLRLLGQLNSSAERA